MFKIENLYSNGNHSWIVSECGKYYLHSDGRAQISCEYFQTRADAEAVLAKYPDAAPHESEHTWKHGDVFKPTCNCMMIFFNPNAFNIRPQVQYISAGYSVDYSDDVDFYLKNAKFLFNINNVVKERQAAKAESWNKIDLTDTAEIINDKDMREFVDWAKNKSFCNSGMHICDRLASQFEAALKHIT